MPGGKSGGKRHGTERYGTRKAFVISDLRDMMRRFARPVPAFRRPKITPAAASSAPKNIRTIGATSRRNAIRRLDGRTSEARYLKQVRNELFAHIGGNPTAPQKLLVERIAVDMLRLQLLDCEMSCGTFSAHDGRVAHALRNSVRLALREIGFEPQSPAPPPVPNLDHRGETDISRRAIADFLKLQRQPGPP